MRKIKRIHGLTAVAGGLVMCLGGHAAAITTSEGQAWDLTPDAWVRGNTADTAYFGWDVLEASGETLGFGQVLDDTTPDLGNAITATGVRFFQGSDGILDPSPTTYGHRSGSGNYYSGMMAGHTAHDTFTATAPASGTGGFTTVVLQLIGGNGYSPDGDGGNIVDDLSFTISGGDADWTLQNSLYGINEFGSGMYWLEWTAPGSSLEFSILMTSTEIHRSLDAFQIDTHWSATGPVVNGITSIPEPGAGLLLLGGGALLAMRRRRAGGGGGRVSHLP